MEHTRTSLASWFSWIASLAQIAIAIGVVYSAFSAFDSLSYSDEERDTVKLCQLPPDAIYKYLYISRNFPPGGIVADYWLNTRHTKIYNEKLELARLSKYGESVTNGLMKAIAVNFNLHLVATGPLDKDIVLTIQHLERDCADSVRRSEFRERFKDFLQFIGTGTLLVLLFIVLGKIENLFSRDNSKKQSHKTSLK